MTSFRYDIDWNSVSHSPHANDNRSNACILGDVIGSTHLTISKDVVIIRNPSRILMDSVQVANAFSKVALHRFLGETIPVSINDETAFYLTYAETVGLKLHQDYDPAIFLAYEE